LTQAGVSQQSTLAFGDEMRVGLCGQVRRVWAPRGVKVRQRVQMQREWRYLALAVDGLRGRLCWCWIASMKGTAIAEAVQAWKEQGIEAVVWDGASGHRGAEVRQGGVTLVQQPPAAPELQPAERVFEELRRVVEGTVYATLEEKVAAVERELQALAADPARVQRLAGWHWIQEAWAALPPREEVQAMELVA
jgi:DDE superfamily endonuclease